MRKTLVKQRAIGAVYSILALIMDLINVQLLTPRLIRTHPENRRLTCRAGLSSLFNSGTWKKVMQAQHVQPRGVRWAP